MSAAAALRSDVFPETEACAAVVFGRGWRDAGDVGALRAAGAGFGEAVQGVGIADRQGLDSAVAAVADPAVEAQRLGFVYASDTFVMNTTIIIRNRR